MPEYEIKVDGGKLVRGQIVCDTCGRCDSVVTYLRAQGGEEVMERKCRVCGSMIRVETKEASRDA